jgi:RNA polymerase sigma-70 factor (ECF subfamily)
VTASSHLANATDHELVARAQQGHEAAYAELLRRHQKAVYELVYRIVREPDTAEDLTQETFTTMIAALGQYRPTGMFAAWLNRIANNLAMDHVRREQQEAEALERSVLANTPPPSGATPTPSTPTRNPRDAVRQAIQGLRGNYRKCVELRFLEERSYEDIAEILKLPVGTVSTYLHRARRELKDVLGPLAP